MIILYLLFSDTTSGGDDTAQGTTQTLAEGTHTFPFSFPVPATAPHSVAGTLGRVSYVLRAVVEQGGRLTLNSRPVTVLSSLPLAHVAGAAVSTLHLLFHTLPSLFHVTSDWDPN